MRVYRSMTQRGKHQRCWSAAREEIVFLYFFFTHRPDASAVLPTWRRIGEQRIQRPRARTDLTPVARGMALKKLERI